MRAAAQDVVEIDPADAAGYAQLFTAGGSAGGGRGFVVVAAQCPRLRDEHDVPSASQRLGTDAALLLLQAIAATGRVHRALWIVTAGAETWTAPRRLRIEQAPVAGFARVAAIEHAGTSRHARRPRSAGRPGETSMHDSWPTNCPAARPRRWRTREPGRAAQGRCATLRASRASRAARRSHVTTRRCGCTSASAARWRTSPSCPAQRRAPGPGEVEIRVRASGLNFRDVLSALGLYPGEITHLGSDCAGEIVAVGRGVTRFAIGDRVVAMAEGAFASHATTRWEFVAPLPAGLDFELGAAIPTAYLTADITLNQIARMKKGDRVLIHSGAGGVGMAAIALAHASVPRSSPPPAARTSAPCSRAWACTTCSTRAAQPSPTR